MSNRVVIPARQAENRFLGSIKCLQIRALYPLIFLSPLPIQIQMSRNDDDYVTLFLG
jgi:hypothetical protein